MYKGIAASRGIGIGSICRIVEQDLSFEAKIISDTAAEKVRFQKAIDDFVEETFAMAEDVRKNIGPQEADILMGHAVMIQDPAMSGEMFSMIDAGQCAEAALTAVCDMFHGMFSAMDDEMMRQRASDIADVKVCILKKLLGIQDVEISKLAPGTVLVCKDLTPSMTSQIVKENVTGIITEIGGVTSHSAILARALEIPAVLSVPGIVDMVEDKDTAIVDGTAGDVFINPDGDVLAQYLIKREDYIKKQAELKKFIGKETLTADGDKLEIYCNIGTPKDAKKAMECDGEGVGLFRSEFLFMDNTRLPTEDEQFEAYKEALASGALKSKDYSQWLDKDGFHRTTIQRGELTSQALVDFCDKARREFYLRPSYIFHQGIMAIKNPRERYRVLRGFGTLVKHLFRKHGELAPVARQAPTIKE